MHPPALTGVPRMLLYREDRGRAGQSGTEAKTNAHIITTVDCLRIVRLR